MPEGSYIFKIDCSLQDPEINCSENVFVDIYDNSAYDYATSSISAYPSDDNNYNDTEQDIIHGPITGGRIEINTQETVTWTVSVEAM